MPAGYVLHRDQRTLRRITMEENQKVLFEGEITYSLQAIKENRKCSMYYRTFPKIVHIIFSVYLIPSLLAIIYPTTFFAPILIIALYVSFRWFGFVDKTTYNRMLSSNQGFPVNHLYHFSEEHIHLQNPLTGNQNKYQYGQIVGLAQTKNYFVLLIVHNQYILLEKASLTGGTLDNFVQFLCANCPNLKPKKLRSNTLGKILYCILLVILALSFISLSIVNIFWWLFY